MPTLDNFIGVKFPGYETQQDFVPPISGQFINDLAGIDIYSAGDMADQERSSGIALLTASINRAIIEQEEKLDSLVRPYLKFLPLIDGGHVGDYVITDPFDSTIPNFETQEEVDAINVRGGVQIRIDQRNRGAKIRIESVELLGDTTTTDTLITIAENRVSATDTFDLDLIEKVITTQEVNQTYDGPLLTIWSTITDHLPAVSYPELSDRVRGCAGCGGGNGFDKHFKHATVNGWSLRGNKSTKEKRTYGMRVNFSIICEPDQIILKMIPRFKTAMLYAAGIQVLEEFEATRRFNNTVSISEDWVSMMLDPEVAHSWVNKYDDAWTAFSDSAGYAIRQFGGDCIECNRPGIKVGRF